MTEALARAGLESSNLIVGIDFTKSNEWTGNAIIFVISFYIAILKIKHITFFIGK